MHLCIFEAYIPRKRWNSLSAALEEERQSFLLQENDTDIEAYKTLSQHPPLDSCWIVGCAFLYCSYIFLPKFSYTFYKEPTLNDLLYLITCTSPIFYCASCTYTHENTYFLQLTRLKECVESSEGLSISLFEQDLGGRLLTVNKAAPRGARPERPPRAFEPGFRIYVGNLPWDVDNGRLEQIFSEHGKVEQARVVFDRETGRSRGFGFVTMSSETEMNDAIAALDGQVYAFFLSQNN